MKTITNTGAAIACSLLVLLSGGCSASKQARSVSLKKSLLVDPSILKKGGRGSALYGYANPKADFKRYSKVLLEPVLVLKKGKLDLEDRENYQRLANNALVYLTQELRQDYEVVPAPEPGAFKFQLAIVDADDSDLASTVLSSVGPASIGLSLVEYSLTGKQMGVGEITCEAKVTDSMTGELLGAALDRRVGRKDVTGLFETWHSADAALRYWAQRSRATLCLARGGAACVKP